MGDCLLDRVLDFIPLFFVSARDVLFVLDFHSPPSQDDRVLLAVTKVEKDPRRALHNHGFLLALPLGPLHHVVFGADEFSGVAEALAAVGKVERGGMTIKC